MQINEYQHLALRTATTDDSLHPYGMLTNGVMGLCGESGECIDIVKKMTEASASSQRRRRQQC